MRKFLDKFLVMLLSVLLVVMTTLVLWQVFTRYILQNPSIFSEELVRIILIWTSFIGAAYAFGCRQHMALVFLKDYSKGYLNLIVTVFIDFLILLVAVIVMVYGGFIATKSVLAITTPILKISKGYMYSPLLVAGLITIFYQVMNIFDDIMLHIKKNNQDR